MTGLTQYVIVTLCLNKSHQLPCVGWKTYEKHMRVGICAHTDNSLLLPGTMLVNRSQNVFSLLAEWILLSVSRPCLSTAVKVDHC